GDLTWRVWLEGCIVPRAVWKIGARGVVLEMCAALGAGGRRGVADAVPDFDEGRIAGFVMIGFPGAIGVRHCIERRGAPRADFGIVEKIGVCSRLGIAVGVDGFLDQGLEAAIFPGAGAGEEGLVCASDLLDGGAAGLPDRGGDNAIG